MLFQATSQCSTLEHMGEVGIRELKQNASAVVARAVEGETMTITDRGRPVAILTGIRKSPLEAMVELGLVDLPVDERGIWELELPQISLPEGISSEMLLDDQRTDRL